MDGTWSDFIYAGGQKVARAESGDQRLHVQGTRCGDGCGWQWTTTNPAVDLGGTVIRPGDRFAWSQYATAGTAAGFGLNFTDGSYAAGLPLADQDGQPTTADGVTGVWHNRIVDLSSQVGKTVAFTYFMTDGETAAGDWSVDYRDVAFLRADSTVTSLYHGESLGVVGTGGMSNLSSSEITQGPGLGDVPFTHYYMSDHLGSARMEFAGGGWPVWSGDYDPYGKEINPQPTVNNYKFTGYERDAETGLDYAHARYYMSSIGRFISPDPYDGSMDFGNPQSLNRYSYVANMPTGYTDPTGLLMQIPVAATEGAAMCASVILCVGVGIGVAADLYELAETLFYHPKFKASHTPRPPWDPHNAHLGLPNVGAILNLPLGGGCEFGACGGGFQPSDQADQKNAGPQYPYLPPWLPQSRNAQGRQPGAPTRSPSPRPVPGVPPDPGAPISEPPPGASGRFWYSIMQILRVINNDLDLPILVPVVDPCIMNRAVCHRPYNGPI